MNLAETLSQFSYGKSADPAAPENQNKDWRDGFAEGLAPQSRDPITAKWLELGEPDPLTLAFKEWKRGYWAGVFSREPKKS